MILSPSRVQKGQTCMKQVWYHYKLGIRPKVTSANLAFGKAVDDTVMDYLKAVTLGTRISSIEDVFVRHWKKQTSISLEYSATQSENKLKEMGAAMAGKFPAKWEESGLMVFIMPDGSPALQVELAVQISPRDSLKGYLDLIAMDQTLAEHPALERVDLVHCVGARMKPFYDALPLHQRGRFCETAKPLAANAMRLVDAGDVVLIKGSKGSKVSTVVDALRKLSHPADE